jgi:hypothetical protein
VTANDTLSPTLDSDLLVCDRCKGRFPGPGVRFNKRTYCCDNCAKGPGVKNMIRMLVPATGLAICSAVVGWYAARIRR